MKIMRELAYAALLLALLALTGCDREKKTQVVGTDSAATSATAATLTPEELGALGASLKKSPDRADDLLRERGLTDESFAAAIRAVSADQDASKRYSAAFRKNEN